MAISALEWKTATFLSLGRPAGRGELGSAWLAAEAAIRARVRTRTRKVGMLHLM